MELLATEEMKMFKAGVTSAREKQSSPFHVDLVLGRAFTSYQPILCSYLISISAIEFK